MLQFENSHMGVPRAQEEPEIARKAQPWNVAGTTAAWIFGIYLYTLTMFSHWIRDIQCIL